MRPAWPRPAGSREPAAVGPIHNAQHRQPDLGIISGSARGALGVGPYRISPWKIHEAVKTPGLGQKQYPPTTARGETMDQSIVGFASAAPRRFRRDWALTVLW